MTAGRVVSWLALAPAILLTCCNLWIRIRNRRGGKYISSILVVPTILALISMLVLANTVGQLKAAGHSTTIALRPLWIATAAIVAADLLPLFAMVLLYRVRNRRWL
jgi:hypothetical protein